MTQPHGSDFSRRSASPRFDQSRRRLTWPQSREHLLTDLLIAALLLVLPLVMGGREAWGHRLLISLSLALGCVWCLHKTRTGGRLVLLTVEPLMVAGLLLVWFQTVPQPPATLDRISSEYARLLPDWDSAQKTAPDHTSSRDSASGWATVSLTPVETRHGILMLAAYVLIAVVVAQRLQSAADCGRLLKLIAVSGVLMAAFAVVQLAASNDRFFWFYRHPYTGTSEVLKGAFTNRNHFAQFLVLSIGPLIWWVMESRRQESQPTTNPARRDLGRAQGNHSSFGDLFNPQLVLLICALSGVVLAILLSLSRGGMMAAAVTCSVAALGLWKNVAMRPLLALLAAGLSLAVVAGLVLAGKDSVETRLEQVASADADQLDPENARRTIWKANLAAIRAFPWFGTGVGSHREVYPVYMPELADFSTYEFSHAESSYIQLALETGLAGLGLLILGIFLTLSRMLYALLRRQNSERVHDLAVIVASFAGGLVHAVADFIWYVPAIVVTTIVLVVTGIRICGGFEYARGLTIPRFGWLCAAAACGAALILVQPELGRRTTGESLWHQYLTATRDALHKLTDDEEKADDQQSGDRQAEIAEGLQPVVADQSRTAGPPSSDRSGTAPAAATAAADSAETTSAVAVYGDETTDNSSRSESIASMQHRMSLLVRSLRANPRQHRVQLRLAVLCLKVFDRMQAQSENPLSLAQIRDAALSSEFHSVAAMHEWLQRAFGRQIRLPLLADQLARQSLRACPVQGQAWITLVETGFLRDTHNQRHAHYISQALLVRGHDPRTRFMAGQQALLAGERDQAFQHWNAVFHANAFYRRAITLVLSRVVPAATLLEQFQPSVSELKDILQVYQPLNRPDELLLIVEAAEQAAESVTGSATTEDQVALLMAAYKAAYALNLRDKAETLLRKAMARDENAWWPRYALGLLLYETERFSEAGDVLLWCYDQQPGDEKLDRLIRDARRKALRSGIPGTPASWTPRQSQATPPGHVEVPNRLR